MIEKELTLQHFLVRIIPMASNAPKILRCLGVVNAGRLALAPGICALLPLAVNTP